MGELQVIATLAIYVGNYLTFLQFYRIVIKSLSMTVTAYHVKSKTMLLLLRNLSVLLAPSISDICGHSNPLILGNYLKYRVENKLFCLPKN